MRLLINAVAWISLVLGGASSFSCIADLARRPYWYLSDLLDTVSVQLVTSALIMLGGLGLVLRRHWGRWLWILGAVLSSFFLVVVSCLWLMSGGLHPFFTGIIALMLGLAAGGIYLLTRPAVKALCR